MRRRAIGSAAVAILFALIPGLLVAQVPQIEPPWNGTIPPAGGVASLAMTRADSPSALATRLEDEGCRAPVLALTQSGRWLVYAPSAPAFVNARVPSTLEAGRAFLVRCAEADQPIVLGEEDAGRTVRADVRTTIRVALPANPSTGYNWRLAEPLPTTVLTQIGEPEFVGPGLPGAGGTLTFEFLVTGPGVANLHLVYDRSFEPASVIDEWSVTIIVQGQQAVAWLGEVKSQPQAAPGARYLELRVPLLEEGAVPPGVGVRGSDGATSNLLASLVDTGTEVLVWGELTCGVADYGDCRVDVTTVTATTATDAAAAPTSPVVGWAGTIRALGGASDMEDLFQLDGPLPLQYGIAGASEDIEDQLAEAREQGQHIRIWGTLEPLADDVNRTRIIVTEIGLAP